MFTKKLELIGFGQTSRFNFDDINQLVKKISSPFFENDDGIWYFHRTSAQIVSWQSRTILLQCAFISSSQALKISSLPTSAATRRKIIDV
jgi:hypothetical protein